MKRREPEPARYAQRVSEEARRYLELLQAENEKLRALGLGLEEEWRAQAAETEQLRREVERRAQDVERLRQQLSNVEEEQHRVEDEFIGVQQELNDLASLYVASYRLHSSLEREEVLRIIEEVVASLIGCEELAVLEAEEHERALRLVASVGIDAEPLRVVPYGAGIVGRAVESGETWVAGRSPEPPAAGEEHLTACIPLVIGARRVGALALFRLLPQKAGLEPLDHELFELLGTHAATALYCSRPRAEVRNPARP